MERERITISIKKDLLSKIDSRIDGLRMRNRSHAIEIIVSESFGIGQIDTAVIMAGGKGALKLIPVIEDSLKKLAELGIHKVYIAIGYLGDKIKQNLSGNYNVEIEFIEGGEGTAGSLNLIKKQVKKTFIIINIDQIFDLELKKIIDFHNKHLPVLTLASTNQNMKGIYIAETEIFDFIEDGFSMLEEDIFPKLLEKNKLLIYPVL